MKTDYQQKLTPVIRYLEQHFEENLNLAEVAQKAHLSPYHFHRIFKAVTAETPAEFLRRLKLEKAASQLFYDKQAVTSVALDFGFSSSQSLAKAFRQYFGVSPSAVRDCHTICAFTQLIRNSKIGHLLRNNGHAVQQGELYSDSEVKQALQIKDTNMKTQHFEPRNIAYIRVTGAYGEDYQAASDKLYAWAGPLGLAEGECIFIYHDNPEITPAEKCRTDICITVPKGTPIPAGIETTLLPAGKYATMREQITDKRQYPLNWQKLMSQAVNAGMEFDQRPCFELYHQYDPATGHADVSFCSAIK